jgi:hypothetical protein
MMPGGRGHEHVRVSDRDMRSELGIDATVPNEDRAHFRRVQFADACVSRSRFSTSASRLPASETQAEQAQCLFSAQERQFARGSLLTASAVALREPSEQFAHPIFPRNLQMLAAASAARAMAGSCSGSPSSRRPAGETSRANRRNA